MNDIAWESIDVAAARRLAYLTDRRRVVYLPTRDGYSILLSVREPQAFLDALKTAPPE